MKTGLLVLDTADEPECARSLYGHSAWSQLLKSLIKESAKEKINWDFLSLEVSILVWVLHKLQVLCFL